MDLQLGLALSCFSDKGFDLNCSEIESRSELNDGTQLGNIQQCNIKKRNFVEAFEEKKINADVPQTLHLLIWDNQTNQEDDVPEEPEINSSVMSYNLDSGSGDTNHGVVGWPPINSWRKKICQQNRRECGLNCVTVENGGGGNGADRRRRNSISMYVKVKMEGVGIARKIDLGLHHSHQTLLHTCVGMFGKCRQGMQSYQLTFQDKEGDWQLAEDVNWESFIRSVQRLQLMRRE